MIEKLYNQFLESRPVVWVFGVARKFKPWGFEGLSLYHVMSFFIEGLQKGDLTTRAAAIAFRMFLALFPTLIILLALIPYVSIDGFQDNLFENIQNAFPGDSFQFFEPTIADLINKPQASLLSIGFILALFYASNSINAILIGFNGSYNLTAKGNVWLIRIISVGLMLVLGLLQLIAMAIIIFSGVAFDYLRELDLLPAEGIVILIDFARWLISISLIYFSISVLYNVGNFKRLKWRVFTAGASFATLFFIIASLGFAYFVNNFSQYNQLYGYIGSLIIFLIWVNFNCIILLLGFELNISIHRAAIVLESKNSLNK